MSQNPSQHLPGGFRLKYRLRMLGTPAPVFPGFEVDITTPVPDSEKPDAVWHNERLRAMLEAHPEIRGLIGRSRSTALWCLLFVAIQVGLAIASASQPWWVVVLTAWLIGSWANMNLFMLGHECNHGLVFQQTRFNRWLFTLTTLPMFLSGHHTWWIEHHTHHNDLGAKKDFIRRRRTLFLLMTRTLTPLLLPFSMFMLSMQFVRSIVGLLVYAAGLLVGRVTPGKLALSILADEHLVSGYHKYRMPIWPVFYALLSLLMVGGLYAVGGWQSILYLLLSQTFMTGFLHPLMFGMILSNSHFHGSKFYQPSSSYYGWFNRLTFHFGLHTEHHDISSIPWNRLPKLAKLAPEFYQPLHQTRSYIGLAFQFVFGNRQHFDAVFANEEKRNAEMLQTTASLG